MKADFFNKVSARSSSPSAKEWMLLTARDSIQLSSLMKNTNQGRDDQAVVQELKENMRESVTMCQCDRDK